jgi:hypothetical protein
MITDVDNHTRLMLYTPTGKKMAAGLGYSLAMASENDVTVGTTTPPKQVSVFLYKNGDGKNGQPFLSCTLSADKGTAVYSSPSSPVVVMLSKSPDGVIHVVANTHN